MRVPVLNPLKHEGIDREVGSFIELDDATVAALRGAVGQEHVPEPVAEAEVPAEPAAALPAPVPDQPITNEDDA